MAGIKISFPLEGIFPPMVTPLTPEKKLDTESLQRLVEHLINGGVSGIFILGTTGESASFSSDFRKNFIEQTLKFVKNRIHVLVGITDPSEEVSLGLAKTAKEFGANLVVAAPPFYFKLGQQELLRYFQNLADKLPLPLFLYNMPSHTQINFDLATVMELSKHPNIVGLKDSSANSQYFQSLLYNLKEKPHFTLLVGPEEILGETVLMGSNGGVNGGANLFPNLYVELFHAAKVRDFSRIIPLQNLVMEISEKIYTVGSDQSSYLKGIKSALSTLGICGDAMASPLEPFMGGDKQLIEKRVTEISLHLKEIKAHG